MSKRIINIEGLIGAGKSTLIDQIQQQSRNGELRTKIRFIPEPVDIWTQYKNGNEQNILQLLYQDPKANSLKFQLIILKSLVDQFKLIDDSYDIVIVERSIESQRKIFVQQFINTGILDILDLQIYEQFRDDLWKPVQQRLIDMGFVFEFVYIQSSLQTCINRINVRNRPGEESIPLQYMQQLESLHESLFNDLPHTVINNDQISIFNQNISQILQLD